MCGIAGFYGAGDQADLEAMTNALVHRGPDDFGFFTSGALKLGHRRLSIVDLAMGQQPMVDPESGLVIVYNGELYNHLELRERLKREGQVFRTSHSDTETVLRSFLVWGSSCFALFNGMFALAIYDPRKQKLWLARDRFGEKPLFYTKNAQGFAFASELGALQLWPHFNSKLDYDNLQRFFGWGYLPAGRTIYQGCQALLPGSFLSFDLKSFELKTESYWQFELCPDESLNSVPEEELVGELRELLVKAVQRRLLADVPLGVFLSGGLDSSCVLAAAAKCLPVEQISAFSIGFTEPSFDESNNAREVATHLGTKHFVSMLTQEDLLNRAPEILKNMSEPLGDASLIPTEHLAAFAREKVTVALSGDGGDELFAGYDPFKALKPAALYRKVVPRPCHALLRAALSLIPSSDRNMSLEFKLKRALRGLSYPSGLELPVWMGPLEPAELGLFFEQPLQAEEVYEDALNLRARHPKADELSQALYFFTRFYLTDDILVKVDRACMQVSLESRAVFLDNDLVAFCQRLPNHFKYRHGQRKYLLRKALEGWIPERILNLPKKGFGIPLNRWLRKMPNTPPFHFLNQSNVERYQKAQHKRRGDYRLFLWSLQVLAALGVG